MLTKYKTEIKWSLIFIVTMLVWMLLERLFGLHDERLDLHQYVTLFFMIPAILIYVLALREKKNKDLGGEMSYMQGFISGLIITAIITVFSPLTQWIISYVITPDFFTNVIEYAVETGYDTRENAEAYFTYKNYAVQSTIWAAISGIVTSAIVAIFVRSK